MWNLAIFNMFLIAQKYIAYAQYSTFNPNGLKMCLQLERVLSTHFTKELELRKGIVKL